MKYSRGICFGDKNLPLLFLTFVFMVVNLSDVTVRHLHMHNAMVFHPKISVN